MNLRIKSLPILPHPPPSYRSFYALFVVVAAVVDDEGIVKQVSFNPNPLIFNLCRTLLPLLLPSFFLLLTVAFISCVSDRSESPSGVPCTLYQVYLSTRLFPMTRIRSDDEDEDDDEYNSQA
jgi:hypothetical protein